MESAGNDDGGLARRHVLRTPFSTSLECSKITFALNSARKQTTAIFARANRARVPPMFLLPRAHEQDGESRPSTASPRRALRHLLARTRGREIDPPFSEIDASSSILFTAKIPGSSSLLRDTECHYRRPGPWRHGPSESLRKRCGWRWV